LRTYAHVNAGENLLNKIRNLMQQVILITAVAGALLVGATGVANASAAPASAALETATPAVQAAGPIKPASAGACTDTLGFYGYTVTLFRFSLCLVAASSVGSAAHRLAACTTGMIGSGVAVFPAGTACLAAVS
jgi:hypothetical protein